ncbi:MAG: penicillin-binding protein activator LpoB, partial [Candidatus Eisenbacteria bacterium]|nr:penicillin-binding protein activator LpoB [Candidatus Eisenbacteria bacterium]
MRTRPVGLLVAAVALLALVGCSRKVVSRIDPNETVDLSGKWNDTDSRLVSDEMIADCLNSPWLVKYQTKFGDNPTVIAGSIRNKSMEHIAVGTFLRDIERALVNSQEVQVVASAEERGEVRAEREDQRVNASPETLKRMG